MTGYVVAGYLIDGGQAAPAPDVVELAQEAAPVTVAPETAAAETMAVETAPAETLPAPAASPGEVPANPVTTADLNLRAGPSFGDAVLMVIPAGAALAPTGEWSQGFVGVTYEGNYGWVDSGWLAAGEPAPQTAPEATKDVALLQEAAPAPVTAAEPAPTKDAALDRRPRRGTPARPPTRRTSSTCAPGHPRAARCCASSRGRPGDDHRRAERGLDPGLVQRHLGLHQRRSPLRIHDAQPRPRPSAWRRRRPAPTIVAADPAAESGSGELAATTLSDVNLRGAPEMTAPVHGRHPGRGDADRAGGTGAGVLSGAVRRADRLGRRGVPPGLGELSATGQPERQQRQEGKVEGSAPADNAELGAGGIIWPVSGGQWTIMQGYHGSSHQNQDSLWQYEYSLDLARVDGNTAGQPVYSPVNGVVRWTDPGTGGISIDIGNGHAVAMFHVTFMGGLEAGTPVQQGQYLGEISGPGGPGFMGTPHLHFTLWATSDNGNWDRQAVPFTGQYAISGMDFPDTGGGNTYRGTEFSP